MVNIMHEELEYLTDGNTNDSFKNKKARSIAEPGFQANLTQTIMLAFRQA
jgi:hypothetical protein